MIGRARVVVAVAITFLCGCATEYGCGAPGGVTCRSVSQVYADATNGNGAGTAIPNSSGDARDGEAAEGQPERLRVARYPFSTIKPGDPIRSGPRLMRVWLKPWKDADDNVHDESYVYTVIDYGQWVLPANKKFTGE